LNVTKLLAPIIPHITDEMWQLYFKKIEKEISVHISSWPKIDKKLIDKDAEEIGDMAVAIISTLRKYKNRRGLSLNAPLEKVSIECEDKIMNRLQRFFKDIKGAMKIKRIDFGKGDTQVEGYPITISVKI